MSGEVRGDSLAAGRSTPPRGCGRSGEEHVNASRGREAGTSWSPEGSAPFPRRRAESGEGRGPAGKGWGLSRGGIGLRRGRGSKGEGDGLQQGRGGA